MAEAWTAAEVLRARGRRDRDDDGNESGCAKATRRETGLQRGTPITIELRHKSVRVHAEHCLKYSLLPADSDRSGPTYRVRSASWSSSDQAEFCCTLARCRQHGGIGDLGPAAHEFVGFLARAKQHVWQVLPLCPTGYGNSPYAGSSAFAGNPFLISLEFLADWGWIDGERISGLPGRSGAVDFNEA